MVFFGDFGLRDTFQERIAPKSIEIGMDKLRMKFSALNVNFDGPSFDFLVLRKSVQEDIKKQYPGRSQLCGVHFKSELRQNGWRIRTQFVNRNYCRLSCVS